MGAGDNLNYRSCNSVAYMYDQMESQSGRWLPVIYRALDVRARRDWRDEGQILDFYCATEGRTARVLDFGVPCQSFFPHPATANFRADDLQQLRAYMLPVVEGVCGLCAPLDRNPWITARK
jgi:hypothetical protein